MSKTLSIGANSLSSEDIDRLRKAIDTGNASAILEECRRAARSSAPSPQSEFAGAQTCMTPSFSSGAGSVFNLGGDLRQSLRERKSAWLTPAADEDELRSIWTEVGDHLWSGMIEFARDLEREDAD